MPRLLYADEIEADEPARAEFVRVQCELAELQRRLGGCNRQDEPNGCHPYTLEGKCLPCQRTYPLRRRERELWQVAWERQAEWFGLPFRATLRIEDAPGLGPYPYAVLSRGFPSRLTLSWADWQRHSAELLAACPLRAKDATVRLTTPPVERDIRDEYAKMDWGASSGRAIDRGDVAGALKQLWGVRFELPSMPVIGYDPAGCVPSFTEVTMTYDPGDGSAPITVPVTQTYHD